MSSGTASIEGRVFDAVTEKAVEGAEVALHETAPTKEVDARFSRVFTRASKVRSGADGSFVFRNIAGGTYRLLATGKNHLTACFGASPQFPGPCADIDVIAGQPRTKVDVYVRQAGVIRGRLIDHEGRPLAGAAVNAWHHDQDRPYSVRTQLSDADGRFELGSLPPGSPVLAADIRGRRGEGQFRVFYPGVFDRAEAQPLNIEPGTAVDVEIRVPELIVAAINAHVSGPADYTVQKLTLMQPETKMRLILNTHENPATVMNLRRGRYALEARATVGARRLAAFAFVDLHSGELDVPLHLQATGIVSGKIVLERGGVPPVDSVRVAAVWMRDGVEVDPLGSDEVAVGPDGLFHFDGLFGYREIRVMGLPPGRHVTAIRMGRRDIGSGFDVAAGSRTELTIVVAQR